MVDKSRIVKGAKPEEEKVEAPITEDAVVPSSLPELIKKARQTAKATGRIRRVVFRERTTGNRPHNVYKENTTDGVFIWWTTEDSKTIGKEDIAEVDEMTLVKEVKGYELTIPFTEEVAKEVQKLGGSYSKYYVKDGERTEGVTFEKFLAHTF